MENSPFPGKYHQNGGLSMAMLVQRSANIPTMERFLGHIFAHRKRPFLCSNVRSLGVRQQGHSPASDLYLGQGQVKIWVKASEGVPEHPKDPDMSSESRDFPDPILFWAWDFSIINPTLGRGLDSED